MPNPPRHPGQHPDHIRILGNHAPTARLPRERNGEADVHSAAHLVYTQLRMRGDDP